MTGEQFIVAAPWPLLLYLICTVGLLVYAVVRHLVLDRVFGYPDGAFRGHYFISEIAESLARHRHPRVAHWRHCAGCSVEYFADATEPVFEAALKCYYCLKETKRRRFRLYVAPSLWADALAPKRGKDNGRFVEVGKRVLYATGEYQVTMRRVKHLWGPVWYSDTSAFKDWEPNFCRFVRGRRYHKVGG